MPANATRHEIELTEQARAVLRELRKVRDTGATMRVANVYVGTNEDECLLDIIDRCVGRLEMVVG